MPVIAWYKIVLAKVRFMGGVKDTTVMFYFISTRVITYICLFVIVFNSFVLILCHW